MSRATTPHRIFNRTSRTVRSEWKLSWQSLGVDNEGKVREFINNRTKTTSRVILAVAITTPHPVKI
jgi:hypothetical protein